MSESFFRGLTSAAAEGAASSKADPRCAHLGNDEEEWQLLRALTRPGRLLLLLLEPICLPETAT